MKRIIRYIIGTVTAVAACLLSGCGTQDKQLIGVDGYVYSAVSIEEDNAWITRRNFTVSGDYLYYMHDSRTIKRLPLEELEGGITNGETVLTVSRMLDAAAIDRETKERFEIADIRDYAVDSDENLICILAVDDDKDILADIISGNYSLDEKEDNFERNTAYGLLCKFSLGGELNYWMELPDFRVLYGNPDWLALDSDGTAYVLTAEAILAVDKAGRAAGQLPVEQADSIDIRKGAEGRLLEGNGGHIFYLAESLENGGMDIFRIDHGKDLGMTPVSLPLTGMNGEIYEGEDCLLKTSGSSLFQYNEAENALVEILKWEDSGLPGSGVLDVIQIDKERYLVTLWTGGTYENNLLTKTPADELAQKQAIVIASVSASDTLRRSVVAFNRASEKYRIIVEDYSTPYNDSEEAYMKLDSSLMSAGAPDILDLTGLDVSKYADKEMLADLNDYIEDDLISRENYLSNLLDGYTMGGRLVSIPREFALHGVIGITPEAYAIENWSIPELMALTEKYPDKRLFLRDSGYLLREFCVPYYLEVFVDWDEGKCCFDSEEFCALLDWVNTEKDKSMQTQDALFAYSPMRFFEEYLHSVMRYGEGTMLYGYPSADGTGIYRAYPLDALGILASSKNKEGAWEFLRYFLLAEEDMQGHYFCFPTRKDLLEEAYRDAVTVRSAPRTIFINGIPSEYDAMEQKQADVVMQAIEDIDFTPANSQENSIVEIVWEEAQYLLDGSKSAEETARAIQNRAALVLDERGSPG